MKTPSLILGLAVILAITFAVAGFASAATADGVSGWYATLNAPSFKPPNGLFAPVWTVLYVFMGVAAWRVWKKGWNARGVKVSLLFYGLQLALNGMWSVIFFSWHALGVALVEIIAMLVAILLTYINFRRVDDWAGYLFLPYIVWVCFATALNGAFWCLN